jgi:20S proteasome alpha/beta subunit
MDNKEAIKYLIRPFATSTQSYNEYLKQKEAYDLAVKALEEKVEKEAENGLDS